IDFNNHNRDREMPWFGQDIFEAAQKKGPLTDASYRKAMAKNRLLSRTQGIDATLTKHRLDALVAPTGGPAWPTDLLNGDHFTGGARRPDFTTAIGGIKFVKNFLNTDCCDAGFRGSYQPLHRRNCRAPRGRRPSAGRRPPVWAAAHVRGASLARRARRPARRQ